jgi:hypothetical protein
LIASLSQYLHLSDNKLLGIELDLCHCKSYKIQSIKESIVKVFLFIMCTFVFTPVLANTFIDAYRVDPNGRIYEMYRVKSKLDTAWAVINGVSSKVPWKMVKKIIVHRADKVEVRNTLVLKDGRSFGNVRSEASELFVKYLATDPVTGARKEQRIIYPPDGSVIEIGTVSGGTRKDSQGNLWPAHYYYSPITGESLGNTPKKKIK